MNSTAIQRVFSRKKNSKMDPLTGIMVNNTLSNLLYILDWYHSLDVLIGSLIKGLIITI